MRETEAETVAWQMGGFGMTWSGTWRRETTIEQADEPVLQLLYDEDQ